MSTVSLNTKYYFNNVSVWGRVFVWVLCMCCVSMQEYVSAQGVHLLKVIAYNCNHRHKYWAIVEGQQEEAQSGQPHQLILGTLMGWHLTHHVE